jgi:uncharacterized membrane protein YukC
MFYYIYFCFVYFKSLDYEVIENELYCKEEENKGYRYVVQKDFSRWMTFFWIGVIVACVGIIIYIGIEVGTNFKFNIIKKCILYLK